MNKEERAEYFTEQMRTIHKKAALLNAAQERKEHEKTRARLKAEREAQKPKTEEELKKKLNSKGKSIEEIIEDGTPEERATLIISDSDQRKAYGIKEKLSTADKKRLQMNLNKRPQEERNTFLFYIKEYDRLTKFYPRLHNYIKAYQVEVSLLATLIAKWEDYDREAEACNKLYHDFIDGQLFKTSDGRTIYTSEAEEFSLCYRNNLLKAHKDWEEATLLYDEATNSFKADIDGDGKLYERITYQAEATKESLSQLKAVIEVVEKYIFEEVAYFVEPILMENSIEMVQEERFPRYYGGPLKYFRSYLSERKEDGETITPEDEKRAVYPNYFEVETDEATLNFAKRYLLNLM